jgi:hypothetical protein
MSVSRPFAWTSGPQLLVGGMLRNLIQIALDNLMRGMVSLASPLVRFCLLMHSFLSSKTQPRIMRMFELGGKSR